MTSGELRDRSNVVTLFITLDDDVELPLQMSPPLLILYAGGRGYALLNPGLRTGNKERVTNMNDTEFLAQFEAGTLPQDQFHHADHLHAAWLYLTRFSALDALAKFSSALRVYTAALGKADRYHETVTWAYLLLIHERIHRCAPMLWEQFAAKNSDLFEPKNAILLRYYRAETLDSELARRVFVMPDQLVDAAAMS